MQLLCEECKSAFGGGVTEKALEAFLQQFSRGKDAPTPAHTSIEGAGDQCSATKTASHCSSSDLTALTDECEPGNSEENNEEKDNSKDPITVCSAIKEPSPKRPKRSSSPLALASPDQKCSPKVHCVSCLGLLEPMYIQRLAAAITDHVRQRNIVGTTTYSLSIHVPISLSLRRMGMEMIAKKLGSDSEAKPSGHITESSFVKEKLRWKLKKELEVQLSQLKCEYESSLLININLDHETSLRQCIGVKKLYPKLFPRPKKQRNKYQPTPITNLPVQRALEVMTDADMEKEGYFLSRITTPCSHLIELQQKSVFVAGRYNKYSRKIPQTPWILDGVRKAETSVQELICPEILDAFRASDVRFSSSGREDVDVLMLDNGRPFLLELVNPMDTSIGNEKLKELQEMINASTQLIAVKQLCKVSKNSSSLLKQGEEEKKKTYSALVWTERDVTVEQLQVLNDTKELVVKQKTPIRVLHRRTLAVREKMIYSMETELLNSHHFRLKLLTQAGTYIKEFVHGDFGRTEPNVGTLLGCDADILSLDVLEVQLEWPPSEQGSENEKHH